MEEQLKEWILKKASTLKDLEQLPCNPLTQFIPYVSTKEIVHTAILADLLNPEGTHGEGDSFLKNFISRLGLIYQDYSEYRVIRERKVSRVLTSGGLRSVDIVVSYKDSKQKLHSVIIENKLNHAKYQEVQVEDYCKGLEQEQIEVDRIVLFYDIVQSTVENPYLEHNDARIQYWYPTALSEWIRSSTQNDNIKAYADYLMSINNQNIPIYNARVMKNFTLDELKKVKKIVDAYNNLGAVLRDEIVAETQQNIEDFKIESEFRTFDEKCKGLKLYNAEDYDRNGLWVTLFSPDSPANDENGHDIYLYTYEDKLNKAAVIAKECGYEYFHKNEGYAFFRSPIKFRYSMFKEREELINELVKLLKKLHEN